jgi:hypothetical protein
MKRLDDTREYKGIRRRLVIGPKDKGQRKGTMS